MPRHPRIVIPGILHHVTQRGNHRVRMFFDDEDREYFLSNLLHYSKKHSLQIADYCLMDNHTHLGVIPECPDSLSRTFKPLHMRYSQYLNRKFKRTGINWQGRFFSSPLDIAHSYEVFKYISLNPVRANLVARPCDYLWSGTRTHLGLEVNSYLTANKYWLDIARRAVTELHPQNLLKQNPSREELHTIIERNVHMNLPVGAEGFISALERRTGLNLIYKPRGGQKKG